MPASEPCPPPAVTVLVPPQNECPPPAPVFVQQSVNSENTQGQNQWQECSMPTYQDFGVYCMYPTMDACYAAQQMQPMQQMDPILSPMPQMQPEVTGAAVPDYSYLNSLQPDEDDAARQVEYDRLYNEWYLQD